MPTPTYTPLANITLGSAAASVTFSSISQSFRDVVLVFNGSTSSSTLIWTRFNGDTGTNYNYVVMAGNAAGTYSANGTFNVGYLADTSVSANTNFMVQLSLMDYSATDKHKSALVRSGIEYSSGTAVYASAHRWANTAAVTSIVFTTATGNWNAGSTFSLYGIASA